MILNTFVIDFHLSLQKINCFNVPLNTKYLNFFPILIKPFLFLLLKILFEENHATQTKAFKTTRRTLPTRTSPLEHGTVVFFLRTSCNLGCIKLPSFFTGFNDTYPILITSPVLLQQAPYISSQLNTNL